MKRSAYTLIELVTALLASTVLIAGLAATISVSTDLLEQPIDDDAAWRDREIVDRIAADMRFARSIQTNAGYGFQLTRPNPRTGNHQTVSYQSSINGLTRQVAGIPAMVLDGESPAVQFSVDGYSAASAQNSSTVVRVRSSSSAASDQSVTNLTIDTPPGCKPGDLLLMCIASEDSTNHTLSESGWNIDPAILGVGVSLVTAYRFYDASYPASTTVTSSENSSLGIILMSIEGVATGGSSPIAWQATDAGINVTGNGGLARLLSSRGLLALYGALVGTPSAIPGPLETSDDSDGDLNVQVFVTTGAPWPGGTIGLPSFVDIESNTSIRSRVFLSDSETSLGIAVRSGRSPGSSGSPTIILPQNQAWVQAALKLEASP